MRVSTDMTSTLVESIQRTADEQQNAFQQLSSGRRVANASDDPAAFALALHTSARLKANDTFVHSTDTLQSMFQTSDTLLASSVSALTRAVTLGVEGSNGALSAAQRQAIAAEVTGIRDNVLSLANTAFNGIYLFAGTKSLAPPFVVDNSDPTGIRYVGSDEVNQIPVGVSLTVPAGLLGSELFSDPQAGVFASLKALSDALVANDPDAISSATSQVRGAFDHISTKRVFYGNALQQLDSNEQFLNNNKVDFSSEWDRLMAADPAEAASRMVDAQDAHDRTLAAAAKLSRMSLLDYLD